MSYASAECLPRKLECLFVETHNWLAISSVRQYQYNELHKEINDGSQPMKIMSDYNTRWLSIKTAVENIIAQWFELKAHLIIARLSEKCYSAELLFEMYSDEETYHSYFFATNPSRCAGN